jgi:hypothetical protein
LLHPLQHGLRSLLLLLRSCKLLLSCSVLSSLLSLHISPETFFSSRKLVGAIATSGPMHWVQAALLTVIDPAPTASGLFMPMPWASIAFMVRVRAHKAISTSALSSLITSALSSFLIPTSIGTLLP